MASAWDEVEVLARQVASARGARWLNLVFVPEDAQFPWHVTVDKGFPDREPLQVRLEH